jgi:hypothetical protein
MKKGKAMRRIIDDDADEKDQIKKIWKWMKKKIKRRRRRRNEESE